MNVININKIDTNREFLVVNEKYTENSDGISIINRKQI